MLGSGSSRVWGTTSEGFPPPRTRQGRHAILSIELASVFFTEGVLACTVTVSTFRAGVEQGRNPLARFVLLLAPPVQAAALAKAVVVLLLRVLRILHQAAAGAASAPPGPPPAWARRAAALRARVIL